MRRSVLLFLFLGTAFYLISSGNITVPLATWLAAVFLLRFSRLSSALVGQGILLLVLMFATYPMLYGIIPPFLGFFAFVLTAYYALLVYLPYGIDRFLAPRISGFLSTLVLPTSAVIVDYFAGIALGTWNSVAYSQHANLPVVQIVSVTGLWGITFMVFWGASVINWAWDRSFEPKRVATGILVFSSVCAVVLLYGGIRLATANSSEETVIAAAVTDGTTDAEYRQALEDAGADSIFDLLHIDPAKAATISGAYTDDLLALTRKAAEREAQIVLWAEGIVSIPKHEEKELHRKAAALAQELRIHIALAYFAMPPDFPKTPGENKTVMIDLQGRIKWDYRKARPVPGAQENPGDGTTPSIATPGGKTGTAICYDMDFPDLIGGAGDNDLMLVPSWDWQAINPLHTNMAVYRAVENGFNLMRSTGEGLSIATDAYGRTLARMDYFTAGEKKIMLAHLPTQGTWTFYSLAGDWFAWLCIIAIPILIFIAVRRKRGSDDPQQ